jgi:hypothetical protein
MRSVPHANPRRSDLAELEHRLPVANLLGNRLDIQMSRLVGGVEAGICLQLTDCKCLKVQSK